MSERYPGGFITKSPPALNPALGNAAPGVWTMDQVTQTIKNGTWPAYDPNFENVTLLLHGNGTNGAQNNTFLDSSTNNYTITRNGNSTQGTFSPYGSNWSNYFDGTGDYLSIADNAALEFGSGDFTIECFIFADGSQVGDARIFHKAYTSTTGYTFIFQSATQLRFVAGTASVNINITTTADFVSNQWNHVAVTRSGSNFNIWINGVSRASGTSSSTIGDNSGATTIGGDGSTNCKGYISNARIVKGTAVYTAAFTPPTAPLTAITNTSLLTCQSNRFIDNSTNAFAITRNGDVSVQRFSPFSPSAAYSASTIGGSGYFDGTGDYLSVSGMSSSITGDITLEAYCYLTVAYPTVASETIFGPWQTGTTLILLRIDGSTLEFYLNGSSVFSVNVSSYFKAASWNHIAVSRGSGTLKAFVNGTQVFSGANSSTIDLSSLRIGSAALTGSDIWDGYFSSLRISSSARYTSGFTPSSSPFTSDANTLLLLNFTNAGIIDNAMMNDLETVGNAQISTTQSKFGGSSMYNPADTTGAGIRARASGVGTIAGDFTIEWWAYHSDLNTGNNHVMLGPWGINSSPLLVRVDNGANFQIYMANASRLSITVAAAGIVATTWQHYAITRSGSTCYAFINGTQVGTWTMTNSLNFETVSVLSENAGTSLAGDQMRGYIDDLRITKGVARYTANFTPQTSQWQDQ